MESPVDMFANTWLPIHASPIPPRWKIPDDDRIRLSIELGEHIDDGYDAFNSFVSVYRPHMGMDTHPGRLAWIDNYNREITEAVQRVTLRRNVRQAAINREFLRAPQGSPDPPEDLMELLSGNRYIMRPEGQAADSREEDEAFAVPLMSPWERRARDIARERGDPVHARDSFRTRPRQPLMDPDMGASFHNTMRLLDEAAVEPQGYAFTMIGHQ